MSTGLDTRFVSGLNDNTRKTVITLLNKRLADMIDLALAVKQAHWTLKGPGFIGVHEMLDQVVDRVNESADMIAERVQVIGGQAQGTLQVVSAETQMAPYPADLVNLDDHVTALVARMADVGERVRAAIGEAGEVGDEDTADLFTEVSRQLDKDAWFIGANIAP